MTAKVVYLDTVCNSDYDDFLQWLSDDLRGHWFVVKDDVILGRYVSRLEAQECADMFND